MKSIHRTSDLLLTDLETIGQHYATTLRLWRQNVEKNREKIRSEYSETFLRKWIYYLCFCEAGFAERAINDVQVVFSHANARSYGNYREGRRAYVDKI